MPPIWKIKNKPFWFVGTTHVLKKEDYPISNVLQNAINIAQLLVLEDKEFLVKGQNIGIYNDGKTIHSELSTKAIDLLRERCNDVGLDFNQVQVFRPWKASIVVLSKLWDSLGFSINYGLDKYLLDTFPNDQVDSLEDSIEILLLFDRLSLEDQESLLIKSLESVEQMTSQIRGVYEACKLGSEDLIIKFVHEPLQVIPQVYQQLILDRNFAWLEKVITLINKRDSALVAVGIGHLVGESNIIDLLISTGYKVDRLA